MTNRFGLLRSTLMATVLGAVAITALARSEAQDARPPRLPRPPRVEKGDKPPKLDAPAPTAAEQKAMLKALVWSAEAKEVKGRVEVSVTVKNTHKKAVLLWPFLALQPVDANGKVAPTTQNFGRWGRVRYSCFPRNISFITVEPGKTHTFRSGVGSWMLDAESIIGWKLAAGEWTLKLAHRFDRAALLKRCGGRCKVQHGDPAWPWNRALETDWSTTLKVTKS